MLGFVLRRLRGRLPLAAAVLLTVLVTATVLTILVGFNRTVTEAGLRRTLDGTPRATVLVSGDRVVADRATDDAAVDALGRELFDGLPVGVESVARSRSYGLPGGPESNGREPDLTVLAAFDRDKARLLLGSWPAPGADRVETVVPQGALARLGLDGAVLPAELTLADRYGDAPLTVRVTGVYRTADREAPYWQLDPLGGREVRVSSFTTYGPLLVDDTVFRDGRLPQGGRSWLLTADFGSAGPTRVERVRERADAAQAAFQQRADGLQVRSELTQLLGELHSATLVTRSGLLIGALQLTVLSGAALLLVLRLVAERQAGEHALLRARGATRRRLLGWTVTEATLLALPAAVLAPLLAGPLLRLSGEQGVTWATAGAGWPVAVGCALAAVLLAALLRGDGNDGGGPVRSRRQALVSSAARSGADLALLALAVLAYQQLSGRSGGLSVDAAGQLGIDPVLVVAPTLALCAGTLLVLRLLPYAARLAAGRSARARGLGPALAGWQLARRPGRANGPVLLLVLAVATGVLALGQHSSWRDSQRDQADFVTAGGLRISGSALPALGQSGRYGSLPGGERLLPVARVDHTLPGGVAAELLLLDATRTAGSLTVRPDLVDGRTPRALFGPLARPASGGVPLPGRPVRIDLTMTVLVQAPQNPTLSSTPARAPDPWVLLRDGFGATHRIRLGQLPSRGEVTRTVDLGAAAAVPLGAVGDSLTLVGFGLTPTVESFATPGEVTLRRITVSDTADGPAVPVPVPSGEWTGTGVQSAPADGQLVTARYEGKKSLAAAAPVVVTAPGAVPAPEELPGLATQAYLTAVGASVGDLVPVQLGGVTVPVRVTAAVTALPTAAGAALVVDLAGVGHRLAGLGRPGPPVGEWWLPATGRDDRTPAEAAAALRAGSATQRLELREEVEAARTDDPLSAAPQSALAALAVVAAGLAAIGFAASAAASAAERARESAVLLALGAPRRLLRRTAMAEQAVLVAIGALVGLGLGALLVRLVVPLLVLTPAARPPVPELLVGLPLGQVLALTAATAVLPLLSAALVDGRRQSLAARIRSVEEI